MGRSFCLRVRCVKSDDEQSGKNCNQTIKTLYFINNLIYYYAQMLYLCFDAQ